jgi:hypothetical protein
VKISSPSCPNNPLRERLPRRLATPARTEVLRVEPTIMTHLRIGGATLENRSSTRAAWEQQDWWRSRSPPESMSIPNERDRRQIQDASGVGLAAGGSMPNVLAVRQVIEKLPVVATSATRLSSPMVFSAAA